MLGILAAVELVALWQIAPKMQLVLVVLEVVSALLRRSSRESLGNHLPVSAVNLEELDELVLLISLPLILSLDAAPE